MIPITTREQSRKKEGRSPEIKITTECGCPVQNNCQRARGENKEGRSPESKTTAECNNQNNARTKERGKLPHWKYQAQIFP
ncbi:hypothetical protein WA026_023012 [Henosepilachna vigintioctopunctata]|uniref:Uncharacterized protein n=1 Tax=Henosepilachna vigintioctopunctata TaxID=420089 RepID=A0AAW1VJE8_9CUCU